MAEENVAAPAPGQTTAVGENAQTSQEERPADAAEAQPASLWDNWLLYAVIIFWVWWLFGNKKRKAAKAQEKQEQARRGNLQKGDEVVTIGRMHGKVVAFTDDTVTLKPDPKFELNLIFDRQAVSRVKPRAGEGEEAPPEAK